MLGRDVFKHTASKESLTKRANLTTGSYPVIPLFLMSLYVGQYHNEYVSYNFSFKHSYTCIEIRNITFHPDTPTHAYTFSGIKRYKPIYEI